METEKRIALEREIVDLILTSVNMRHKDKSLIDASTPLVGDGLGLDSLDVLEVVVALEKKYGIKLGGAEEGKQVFRSVGSLTDYVQGHASA